MFEVTYEISEITPNYAPYIGTPVFWGFLIALIRERYFLKNSEFSKASRLKYFTWLFSILLLTSLSTISLFTNYKIERTINQLIASNNGEKISNKIKIESIEGYVENFIYAKDFSKGGESFTVNGKKFSYISGQYYGYHTYAKNGGLIRPGKYLRIHFIYLNPTYNRIIFKIEEDVEKSKNNKTVSK